MVLITRIDTVKRHFNQRTAYDVSGKAQPTNRTEWVEPVDHVSENGGYASTISRMYASTRSRHLSAPMPKSYRTCG
jgi:hypothetical protein